MKALLLLAFAAVARAEVTVVIDTAAGVIEAAIGETRAPVTAANFLRYVDAGHYNGGRFHRTVRSVPDNQPRSPVKIDVIQAAAGEANENAYPPIPLERTSQTGLRHVAGAVSMARGERTDSATSGFFICVTGQPELDAGGRRNPDGQGFAVFGRVTRGMDVVRRIHESPSGPSGPGASAVLAGDQRLTPPVAIRSIRRK